MIWYFLSQNERKYVGWLGQKCRNGQCQVYLISLSYCSFDGDEIWYLICADIQGASIIMGNIRYIVDTLLAIYIFFFTARMKIFLRVSKSRVLFIGGILSIYFLMEVIYNILSIVTKSYSTQHFNHHDLYICFPMYLNFVYLEFYLRLIYYPVKNIMVCN